MINSKDIVPRHPLTGGYVGVGTHYIIDEEEGGKPNTWWDNIKVTPSVIGDFFTFNSVKSHLFPAYLESFEKAAVRFNATGHA